MKHLFRTIFLFTLLFAMESLPEAYRSTFQVNPSLSWHQLKKAFSGKSIYRIAILNDTFLILDSESFLYSIHAASDNPEKKAGSIYFREFAYIKNGVSKFCVTHLYSDHGGLWGRYVDQGFNVLKIGRDSTGSRIIIKSTIGEIDLNNIYLDESDSCKKYYFRETDENGNFLCKPGRFYESSIFIYDVNCDGYEDILILKVSGISDTVWESSPYKVQKKTLEAYLYDQNNDSFDTLVQPLSDVSYIEDKIIDLVLRPYRITPKRESEKEFNSYVYYPDAVFDGGDTSFAGLSAKRYGCDRITHCAVIDNRLYVIGISGSNCVTLGTRYFIKDSLVTQTLFRDTTSESLRIEQVVILNYVSRLDSYDNNAKLCVLYSIPTEDDNLTRNYKARIFKKEGDGAIFDTLQTVELFSGKRSKESPDSSKYYDPQPSLRIANIDTTGKSVVIIKESRDEGESRYELYVMRWDEKSKRYKDREFFGDYTKEFRELKYPSYPLFKPAPKITKEKTKEKAKKRNKSK